MTYSVVEGIELIEMPNFSIGIEKDDGWGPIDIFYRSLMSLFRGCDLIYSFAHPPNVTLPSLIAKYLRGKK